MMHQKLKLWLVRRDVERTRDGKRTATSAPTIKTLSPAFLLFVFTWHISVCNLDFELSESL